VYTLVVNMIPLIFGRLFVRSEVCDDAGREYVRACVAVALVVLEHSTSTSKLKGEDNFVTISINWQLHDSATHDRLNL
jgi:hypothetical protein